MMCVSADRDDTNCQAGAGEAPRGRAEIVLRPLDWKCFIKWCLEMFAVSPVEFRHSTNMHREEEGLWQLYWSCLLCAVMDVKWLNLTGGQRHWKQQRSKRGTEDKRCWSRGEEGRKGIDGTELSVVVTPLYEYLLKTLNARNLHSMTHNDAPRSRNTLEIYRHHV